jgi:hypothetical protein
MGVLARLTSTWQVSSVAPLQCSSVAGLRYATLTETHRNGSNLDCKMPLASNQGDSVHVYVLCTPFGQTQRRVTVTPAAFWLT